MPLDSRLKRASAITSIPHTIQTADTAGLVEAERAAAGWVYGGIDFGGGAGPAIVHKQRIAPIAQRRRRRDLSRRAWMILCLRMPEPACAA